MRNKIGCPSSTTVQTDPFTFIAASFFNGALHAVSPVGCIVMGFLYSQVVFSLTIVQARLNVFGNGDDAWFVNAYHWRNRYDVAFASGIRMG